MTRRLALCGVLCALGVVLLCFGSLIPGMTYCCPVLASLPLLLLHRFCGRKYAWTAFFATALLGLLLAPDKEIAALYLALGCYPLLQPRFERMPGPAGWACRLVWFNAAVLLVYAALVWLLRLDSLRQELLDAERWLLLALLVGGNLVFVLYDRLLLKLDLRLNRRFSQKKQGL